MLELNRELVLSTAHVTQFECNSDLVVSMNYSNDQMQIRLCVDGMQDQLNLLPVNELELYTNMINCIDTANSLNCKWLVLDCDGQIADFLPTFEW